MAGDLWHDLRTAPQGAGGALLRDTIGDPRWFPLRFNRRTDVVEFALIPVETHASVTFLADLKIPQAQRRTLSRADIHRTGVGGGPLHLVLHSGLGGSTLLARALAQPGIVTTFKEPPILTDIVGYGLANPPAQARQLLGDVTSLLGRPFTTGEARVCKMSSVGNGLVSDMAARDPASHILCLQTPLDQMLASMASRGIDGRIAARKLFLGMRNAGMIAFDMSDRQALEHSDLQLAAIAWLSVQKMGVEVAARFGPGRVRSLSSQDLLDRPGQALAAVAAHLGIALDVEERLASGIFERHAKTGEPFSARDRNRRISETLAVHRGEIDPVVSWARKVADASGIALDPPSPLQP